MTLTVGKIRGLQKISDARGVFTMCAMDHRGSLEQKICAGLTPETCRESMTDFKADLCRILSPYASAALLDPIFGAAQVISQGLLAQGTGLLVSLEETGYGGGPEERTTSLLPGWSVAKIKRMAADAVKLLVYYRPDLPETARLQKDLVLKVAGECRRYDLPCVVEAVSYLVGKEKSNPGLFARRKPGLVIQTARDLTAMPIDVFKAEFPADLNIHSEAEAVEACRELNAACSKPWVILSAGADYETFAREVSLACRAGASGYLAGRAIWQEAIPMESAARRGFLAATATARLKKIAAAARRYASPWQSKLNLDAGKLFDAGPDWYQEYGEACK
jgi:tagatose 1,6-diphosphate aldolase